MVGKPIQWIFGLVLLIGVGLGVFLEFEKAAEIKGILGEGAKRVEESIKANGCLTQNAEANIAQYLQSSGLKPAQVYFNASTGRQSYGSTAANGALGYDFTIKVPGFNLPIFKVYLEKEIPNVNSEYVTGMTADTSACVGTFSDFSGVQMPVTDLGPSPTSNVSNPSIPTALTLSGPSMVTVGKSVQYNGVVNMGMQIAPAGTQVEIQSPNGTTMVTTLADGSFTATVTFPSVGPQVVTAKAGVGYASENVTVNPDSPAQIVLTNQPSGGGSLLMGAFRSMDFGGVSADASSYQVIIGNPVTIQGLVADTNGNSIPGISLGVSADTSDVTTQSLKTNAQGAFSLTYTPTTLGNQQITFTTGSASVTANVEVNQGNPQTISLQCSTGDTYSAAPLTITAGQSINLQGMVAGPSHTPVANAPVSISSPTDQVDNLIPLGPATSDSSGRFGEKNVVLTQAGIQTIQASTGQVSSAQVQITVKPACPYQVVNLQATPTQIGTGGTVTVTGQIEDSFGNDVLSGTALNLVGPDGSTSVQTNAGGTFSVTQTVSTTGTETLSVQANGTPLRGGTLDVNVLPQGAYIVSIVTALNGSPATSITAGQTLTATISVRDFAGNPVAGKTLSLSETPEPSALPQSTVTTDSGGQALATLGPLTKAGYHSLTASVNGVTNTVGTATYQVIPAGPSLVIASVSPTMTTLNPSSLPVVSGVLFDSYGNPIPDTDVTVSGGFGPNAAGTTDHHGNLFLMISPENLGGPYPLTISSGTWSDTPSGLALTVTSSVNDSMSLSAAPDNVKVGEAMTVTATVKDAGGNPVSGLALQFSSPSQTDATISTPASTDASGQTSVTIIFTKVGHQVIQAMYQNIQASCSVTVNSADPTTNGSLSVMGLTLSPQVVVKNPNQGPIVTGTLIDNYNNPVANALVTVSGGWGESSSGVTSSSGVFAITLNPTNTGTFSLTITSGLYSHTFSSPTLTVTETQGYQLSISAPGTTTAGLPVTATATLLDQSGNAVNGATLNFSSPTDSATITTATPTDSSGKTNVEVTWTHATSQIIQVSYQSNVQASAAVTVAPGAPTTVNSTVSPTRTVVWTEQNPVPLPIISGTVTDSYANPIPRATVIVSGGFGPDSPSVQTDDLGYFLTSLKPITIGGPYPITVTIGSWSVIIGDTLTVTPTPPTLTVTPITSTAIADVNVPYSILATLKDSNGTPIVGVPIALTIPTDGDAVYSRPVTTDSSGSAVFTVEFSKVSNQILNFSATANGKPLNTTLYLYSAVPILGNFVYQSVNPTEVHAGNAMSIKGFVFDQFGNPMPPGTAVSVSLPGSNAINQMAFTDSNGLFTASLTPTKVGSFSLNCTVNDATFIYGTTITVLAGPPTTGTITVGSPSIQTGTKNTVNIHLADNWGNNVPGATVTLGTDADITVTQPLPTDENGNTSFSEGPFPTLGIYHFYTTSPVNLTSNTFVVYDVKYITATGPNYSTSGAVPSTYNYNSGGYVGTLNRTSIGSYLAGGSYTPPDSKTVSTSQSLTCYIYWVYSGGWQSTGQSVSPSNYTNPVYYNSGGYSGTLTFTGAIGGSVTPSLPSTGSDGDTFTQSQPGTAYYSGTVTKPAVDTRYYYYYGNYSGYVTKMP
ncbi:Ig-like domain-containing protein [Desulfosporosinus sp. FKA]|uniref:beta strand repeat-containing protein n=1 Tax=Desulfosporosinus sp. FKA TaxID=1969834 RepID=UPI000B49DE30|nr:Ig-like domain-containing protein [Desulfosporosinus sp. FKA]